MSVWPSGVLKQRTSTVISRLADLAAAFF